MVLFLMEKFLQNLQEAEKIIRLADHMIYVTFPLLKEKKILFKVISEIKIAISNCISSILLYEHASKRVSLYKNPEDNLQTFREKCAQRYGITKEEIFFIKEIFDISEKHRESSFEFVRDGNIVILSEDLKPKTISLERIKQFLLMSKTILRKSREGVTKNFSRKI